MYIINQTFYGIKFSYIASYMFHRDSNIYIHLYIYLFNTFYYNNYLIITYAIP